MRVLCVTLLLWAGVQGVKLQKDLAGSLGFGTASSLEAQMMSDAKEMFSTNALKQQSAMGVASQLFQAFRTVHGEMPEGFMLNPRPFMDDGFNVHIPFNFFEKVTVPETVREAFQRATGKEMAAFSQTGTGVTRSLRAVLTCQCPLFMTAWVTVMKARKIDAHLTECGSLDLKKTWHTVSAKGSKPGADTILKDTEWTKLNTKLIKLAGEPLPRTINNQYKLVEVMGRGMGDYFESKTGSRYDNIMLRWVTPFIACSGGLRSFCLATAAELNRKYPNAIPSAMKPYFDGLQPTAAP